MKTKTTILLLLSGLATVSAQEEAADKEKHRRPPIIPRSMKRPDAPEQNVREREARNPEKGTQEVRTIDGSGNNLRNLLWGAAHQPVIRLFGNAYADGANSPAGAERPSAREISNAVAAQSESILNKRGASDFLWQWGQFLDHDIVETPTVDPAEEFNISVPAGDPWFDPAGTGEAYIPLNRSLYEEVDGIREQINAITAYIDASQVYGSDDVRATALRRNDGSGKLNTTPSDHGDLLPYNLGGFENAGDGAEYFLAGDVRANEQVGLTALHTLFVREHNHWAGKYAEENPDATDEEVYQFARKIVAAEMQAITYREFLPILLGPRAIPPYDGYKPEVRADISNEFGGASYRVGHTLISPDLLRLDADGNEIEAGSLSLAGAFFNPAATEEEGIAATLRGLASQQCQELDHMIVDELRNFLFGPPGSGGLDLASLNIQRGRDHGLVSYNDAREKLKMPPVRRYEDISHDAAERLENAYETPEDLDLWITGLCEPAVPEAMVGPVFHKILRDQFIRLRDGDRFYYKHSMTPEMIEFIEQQTLAVIIRRNTEIEDEISDNVFLVDGAAEVPELRDRNKPDSGGRERKRRR
ncbi:hypothetical protein NT6N_18840 [Oceaniferula spumae]|uniref:Peroxidase n=1 Tax=Oceaniferula spumae TaxID=2979115 RepID=A0AAT9FLM8_9BACT